MHQYDLFLAYAGPDHGTAKALAELLHGRVTIYWDAFLRPEDEFDRIIPDKLESCRVFTVLVSSSTWDGQHYASEELAIAIARARKLRMTVIPVWLDDIPVERRPYGVATKVGISLDRHAGCLGCVASALVEATLRVKLLGFERQLASRIGMADPAGPA